MVKNTESKLKEIQNKIYTIRNTPVMLDKDIAAFYGIKPIRLREQVKRNIERFPADFMFRLREDEVEILLSQNAIPSRKHLGGYLPYVFTEQGVAAISSVIKSKRAVRVSIQIMRAFVAMRHFIKENAHIFKRLDRVELKQIKFENDMEKVLNAIESGDIQRKQGIFFKGQIFEAHNFLSDIIRSAKKSIILVDNYIDDSVLINLNLMSRNSINNILY